MTATDAATPLDEAIRLAVEAHRGQVDKAGAPYILHPLRMMLTQPDDLRRIVAVLHDVVEDRGITLDTLGARFGMPVAEAVDALTKRADEDYDAFIDRCARNPIARDVKRADIMDNLDLSRLPVVTERDEARAAKYRRALAQLDAASASKPR
ncbi:MAG: HD domain-containing protein [Sphingomonas pseudosanguinis]|uniref:HD domain-containing protein n=1 Tax=Sphingomonas pseudosanguinis TaxID=413712 RepID=UPI00391918D8